MKQQAALKIQKLSQLSGHEQLSYNHTFVKKTQLEKAMEFCSCCAMILPGVMVITRLLVHHVQFVMYLCSLSTCADVVEVCVQPP